MSESTLSEIIEEEVRRSLYEAAGINDDLTDLARISQKIAIRSAARIDATMILIHPINRDRILATVRELVNDRLRNQWLGVDATLRAVVDHVVDKIEDSQSPEQGSKPTRDRDAVATNAITAIGNALGILKDLREIVAENAKLWCEINRLNLIINSPQTADFMEAVRVEAAHQVRYWGTARDSNKHPEDWVTMIVCLLGKTFNFNGDRDKLLQHVVTLAAICLNWHSNVIAPRSGDGPANDKEGTQKRSADNLKSVDALIAREGLDR